MRPPTRDVGTNPIFVYPNSPPVRTVRIQGGFSRRSAGIDSRATVRSTSPNASNSYPTPTSASFPVRASGVLDHKFYPHLVDMIMFSSPQALLSMRTTCRALCDRADAVLYERIALFPPYDRKQKEDSFKKSYQGSYVNDADVRGWGLVRLPCNVPDTEFQSLKLFELFHVEVRGRLRQHTRCIDMTAQWEHVTNYIPHTLNSLQFNSQQKIVLRRFVPADNSCYQATVIAFVDLSYTNRYDWMGRPVVEFGDDLFYNSYDVCENGIVNIRYHPDIPLLDQAILVNDTDELWPPRHFVVILQRFPLLGANGHPEGTDFSDEPVDQPFGMIHYLIRYLYSHGPKMAKIIVVGLNEVPRRLLLLGPEFADRQKLEQLFVSHVHNMSGTCKAGEERNFPITFFDLRSYRDHIGAKTFELYTDGYSIPA